MIGWHAHQLRHEREHEHERGLYIHAQHTTIHGMYMYKK